MRRIKDDTDEREKEIWEPEVEVDATAIDFSEEITGESVLNMYLKDIGKKPLLSDEEVKELAERIADGDEEAKQKLIEGNYRLVVSIAKHYKGLGHDLMDLIQDGNSGLMKAAERYDHTKGFKFSTYATWWIKEAIKKTLSSGKKSYWKLVEIDAVREHFLKTYNRMPSMEELAKETNYSERTIQNLFKLEEEKQSMIRLDKPVADDEDKEMTLGDNVRAQGRSVEDSVVEELRLKEWNTQVEGLEDTEKNRGLKAVWMYMQKVHEEESEEDELERLEDNIKKKFNMTDKDFQNAKIRLARMIDSNAGTPMTKREEKLYKLLVEEKDRLGENPSGETDYLDELPEKYEWIFADMEVDDLDFEIETFIDSQEETDFFEAVSKIRSTPPYKCIIRYLLAHYNIIISEKNEDRIWEVLSEIPEISVKEIKKKESELVSPALRKKLENEDCEDVIFSKEECKIFITLILKYLKEDYEICGITVKNWTKYFKDLLNELEGDKPSSESKNVTSLNEMALATDMDINTYYNFRKKLLKRREKDYLDKEFIYMYLTLKYARSCDMLNYKEAYDKLVEFYDEISVTEAEVNAGTMNDIEGSIIIGEKYLQKMEMFNDLKGKYKMKLFKEAIPELADMFKHIEILKQKGILRSDEKILNQEWNNLEQNMETENRTEILQYLYGEKSKGKKDIALGKEYKNYFIDSVEFAHTYIEDNTFSQFTSKGERNKRNIILTLVFLNLTFDLKAAGCLDYAERVDYFEERVMESMAPCGFRILHSGSAYDTYLKFLLACPDPMELFRYVWRKKRNAEEA